MKLLEHVGASSICPGPVSASPAQPTPTSTPCPGAGATHHGLHQVHVPLFNIARQLPEGIAVQLAAHDGCQWLNGWLKPRLTHQRHRQPAVIGARRATSERHQRAWCGCAASGRCLTLLCVQGSGPTSPPDRLCTAPCWEVVQHSHITGRCKHEGGGGDELSWQPLCIAAPLVSHCSCCSCAYRCLDADCSAHRPQAGLLL